MWLTRISPHLIGAVAGEPDAEHPGNFVEVEQEAAKVIVISPADARVLRQHADRCR
ncbi:hypothetical protein [Amycolatopsis sp. NPDC051061]|uniref:hypothetical protein n=1 Tax=Amycolatopsis sp. NPDC051061 TaxID=3155042 RepID=UPI003430BE00